MATVTNVTKPSGTNRFVLEGVSFKTYYALRRDLDQAGRRVRLAFDRGTLEIMSPLSYEHEWGSRLLGFLIEVIAYELNIAIASAKSTTIAREDLDRGVEADECFYIANERLMRTPTEINLPYHPAPDLAIEVDVSQSSLNKLSLYAALGVPEFWRFENGEIHILALRANGRYEAVDASVNFPFLTKTRIEDWVKQREATDQTTWLHAVHDWVRDEIAPRYGDQAGR